MEGGPLVKQSTYLAFARRRYLSSLRMTMYMDSDSTQPGRRWFKPGDTPGSPACSWLLIRQKGNATFARKTSDKSNAGLAVG